MVWERFPTVISSTFRSVLRMRLRIRAAFTFSDSVKPSLEPRSAFSNSAFGTPLEGYPFEAILTARSYLSRNITALPASIAAMASSMVASSFTSEIPRLFSRIHFKISLCGISHRRLIIWPTRESRSIILLTAVSI